MAFPNLSRYDITLLAHMYTFDNTLRKTYPDMSANTKNRTQFYHPDTPKTLSQAYQAGVCQCAEIALLAQAYLQQQHVDSRYFSGKLLHTAQDEFGEAHSFITLTTERGDYVYDPANPTSYSGVCLPRISSVETTEAQKKLFEQKIHTQNDKRNCAFLAAKDLITKTTWYYGCGDGEDIFPAFIINRPTATPSIPDHSQTYG